jgi:diguanylate cyclase (GGDEF)-like protein/PAS domain S-box-containing protein
MSMPVQQAAAPDRAQIAPPPTWLEWQSAGKIDPLLDRAMALARVGAWSCNLANNGLSWTSGVYDIFGLPLNAALDRRQMVEMYTEEGREAMERLRADAIARRGTFTLDAEIKRPDGEMRWIRLYGEMVHQAGGTPILHGLKQDVTEEKLRSEALRRLAEHDALTGLASRAVYESRFLNRRCNASPLAPLGALILFDLDGFKKINDRLGHLAGDACLRIFAERLSASFPDAMLIARIGGDEFALIVGNDKPADMAEARVAEFLAKLRAPILWREHIFTVGATSGIAVPSDPYSYDPEELFARADAMLYARKRKCRRTRATDRR